jgi:hypothetical protein
MNETRRKFLKVLGLSAGAGLLGVFNGIRVPDAFAKDEAGAPIPAGEKLVSENDALPKALGYKHNVKDIDYKKYPKRKEKAKANEFCENCALYTKSNDGYGKCTMMATAGVVAAKGWCGSWSKKS